MKNQKLIKILAAVTIAAGVSTTLMAAGSAPLTVETITLEAQTAEVIFTEQGQVVYESSRDVTSMLSGEVVEWSVEEGQQVKQGDVIAKLSASDAEYQIQRLENDIKGYNAQIYNLTLSEQKEKESLQGTRNELIGQFKTLNAQVEDNKTADSVRKEQLQLQEEIVAQNSYAVRLARENLRGYRDDYGSDNDDPEYNQYRLALVESEKALTASEQRLLELKNSTVQKNYYDGQKQSLNAQIDSIDTRLGKNYSSGLQSYYYSMIESAKLNIQELTEKQGKTDITAPCDGVVVTMPVKDYATVAQGTLVATIGCSPIAEVYVPVREIDSVHVGDKIVLTVAKRTGDTVCAGRVVEIENQAEIKLSPLGIEESKVRVLVRADDGAVTIGYQMDVQFTVFRQENCVVVPKKALFEQDGQDSVWVVRDGTAQIQPVVKGVETRGGFIIDEGVAAGDVVVSDANTSKLAPGKKVQA